MRPDAQQRLSLTLESEINGLACNGAYATAQDYADFWCVELGIDEEAAIIDNYLAIAASDIHVALAASGACDCTLAPWAETYLIKLNVVDAAVYHQCPCGRPNLTDDLRIAYLNWMNKQLAAIREGRLEVCQGATGADFPALAWAEQSLTAYNAALIIYNERRRNQ